MSDKRYATGLISLLHCLASNRDYDVKVLPRSYMVKIAADYKNFTRHANAFPHQVPEIISSKSEMMKEIHDRLVELELI